VPTQDPGEPWRCLLNASAKHNSSLKPHVKYKEMDSINNEQSTVK